MPFPKDHTQSRLDDCFRCCIAYYLDWHPSKVKFFKPDPEKRDSNFWDSYKDWVNNRTGLEMLEFWTDEAIEMFLCMDKKWIAVVPSLSRPWRGDTHAIVMMGDKLIYDPSEYGRKRKPKKFLGAIILADEVEYNGNGFINFIY